MSKCYRTPFLKKVIAKIDFSAKYNLPQKGLPKEISDEILRLFPIPESKETITKQIQLSNQETKEIILKQNHLFFHGRSREKTLCITPEYLYIDIFKYETYEKMKNEFALIIDKLYEKEEFSIRRFGLRYINQIHFNNPEDNSFLEWEEYINSNLLSFFRVPKNKILLSRAFSNVVQQFDDSMLLNFQYGMHNPDFPSRIKQKLFILDFDAYLQGLINKEEIKNYVEVAHQRIEELFENSITQGLRKLMEEVEDE